MLHIHYARVLFVSSWNMSYIVMRCFLPSLWDSCRDQLHNKCSSGMPGWKCIVTAVTESEWCCLLSCCENIQKDMFMLSYEMTKGIKWTYWHTFSNALPEMVVNACIDHLYDIVSLNAWRISSTVILQISLVHRGMWSRIWAIDCNVVIMYTSIEISWIGQPEQFYLSILHSVDTGTKTHEIRGFLCMFPGLFYCLREFLQQSS